MSTYLAAAATPISETVKGHGLLPLSSDKDTSADTTTANIRFATIPRTPINSSPIALEVRLESQKWRRPAIGLKRRLVRKP